MNDLDRMTDAELQARIEAALNSPPPDYFAAVRQPATRTLTWLEDAIEAAPCSAAWVPTGEDVAGEEMRIAGIAITHAADDPTWYPRWLSDPATGIRGVADPTNTSTPGAGPALGYRAYVDGLSVMRLECRGSRKRRHPATHAGWALVTPHWPDSMFGDWVRQARPTRTSVFAAPGHAVWRLNEVTALPQEDWTGPEHWPPTPGTLTPDDPRYLTPDDPRYLTPDDPRYGLLDTPIPAPGSMTAVYSCPVGCPVTVKLGIDKWAERMARFYLVPALAGVDLPTTPYHAEEFEDQWMRVYLDQLSR